MISAYAAARARMRLRQNSGKSAGVRDVMRLPSSTTAWSTKVAPAFSTSSLRATKHVAVLRESNNNNNNNKWQFYVGNVSTSGAWGHTYRPRRILAEIKSQGPWHCRANARKKQYEIRGGRRIDRTMAAIGFRALSISRTRPKRARGGGGEQEKNEQRALPRPANPGPAHVRLKRSSRRQ